MIFFVNQCSYRCRLFKRYISIKVFSISIKSWSIAFFGSDNFSIVSLQELINNRNKKFIKNVEVVTVNNSCLYKFATANNIKTHLWPPKFQDAFDFGVIVSFGKLIPKSIIELFPLGIINVHPSLLPRWRGAMPIFYSIKNGDFTTGITIQSIHPHKFDTGEIILQKTVNIGENEMYTSLHNRLSKYSSECLLEVIREMPHCLDKKVVQPNEGVSLAKKITRDIAYVNWKKLTAFEVYNLHRAVYGLYTLRTFWKDILINLICLSLHDSTNLPHDNHGLTEPGQLKYFSKQQCLLVQCKEGVVRICSVRINGKLYDARNFYLGFLSQDKNKMIFHEK